MSEITVLVPSYNHASYIETCLRSIFAQTKQPETLIVIDDGSDDDSVQIIERVLSDCPFSYQFIKRENRGLCATLNEGLKMVDTVYMAYLGSDDVWLPTFLENRIELLEERTNAVVAYGNAFVIDESDNIFDDTTHWAEYIDGDVRPMLLTGNVCMSPSVVYRTSPLKKYEWNEESGLEDYEMYLKLSTVGEFALGKEILCAHRVHGSNVSGNYVGLVTEMLGALDRCRRILGLDEKGLRDAERAVKFNAVFQLIRVGEKRRAFSWLWENKEAAHSTSQLFKLLFRLLIPKFLFKWNMERKKREAIGRNGNLGLLMETKVRA